MQRPQSYSTAQPPPVWEETLCLPRSDKPTPMASITAGRPSADAELVQRVLERARARVAFAGQPGSDTADYVLGSLLGAGGMGQVYAATQVSLQRTVAVKVLRAELLKDQRARGGFFAEAFITSELDHPHTVPVHEIGLNDAGAPFYAMKLVTGAQWSSTLPTNPVKENLRILLLVCDVLALAHDKGIIHRDLKPENVMLGAYGEVLLMDWGLAARLRPGTDAGVSQDTVCAGTPAYMPPEVAGCETDLIGKASDIYLLGGILYEIATGLTPHGGTTALECILAACGNKLQPATHGGELLDIALHALETEPCDRYASVAAFAAAVREALTHIDSFAFVDQGRRRFEALPGLDRDEIYRECHEIIGLYQRALAHWPGNVHAAEGLVRVRDTLAAVALRRGEIQLARSQVRAQDQERVQYNLGILAADDVAERIRVTLADNGRRGSRHPATQAPA